MSDAIVKTQHAVAALARDKNGSPVSEELRVAVVAILLRGAQVSHGHQSEELNKIMNAIFLEFGLSELQGGELLEVAQFLNNEPQQQERFVELAHSHYSREQREHLLSLAWAVLGADGIAEREESCFAAQLRVKLGLSLEQAVRAQQLATNREQ